MRLAEINSVLKELSDVFAMNSYVSTKAKLTGFRVKASGDSTNEHCVNAQSTFLSGDFDESIIVRCYNW